MQGTNEKTMLQFCSVCKEHFEMEVIKQGSSKSAIWLKCPGCQGFLPHMFEDEDETGVQKEAAREPSNELALEDLDVENARQYLESDEYQIGDIIHHRSWNDYGKVIAKEQLPGNRKTIWALFLRQGKVRLLEGVRK